MQRLDSKTLQELTELLLPFCQTSSERQALFTLAFGIGHPLLSQLNYADSARVFVLNAIVQLNAYGEIEPGKTALWALLQELRRRVGIEKQHQIDRLADAVNTDDGLSFQSKSDTRSAIRETASGRPSVREMLRQLNTAETHAAWSEVIEIGEMLLKANPYQSSAVSKTANAYLQRGKQQDYYEETDVALADLSRALSLNPLMQDAYYERGKAYTARGDYESALADLNRAIQLDPDKADYYRARASAYKARGILADARRDLSRAEELSVKLSKKS